MDDLSVTCSSGDDPARQAAIQLLRLMEAACERLRQLNKALEEPSPGPDDEKREKNQVDRLIRKRGPISGKTMATFRAHVSDQKAVEHAQRKDILAEIGQYWRAVQRQLDDYRRVSENAEDFKLVDRLSPILEPTDADRAISVVKRILTRGRSPAHVPATTPKSYPPDEVTRSEFAKRVQKAMDRAGESKKSAAGKIGKGITTHTLDNLLRGRLVKRTNWEAAHRYVVGVENQRSSDSK